MRTPKSAEASVTLYDVEGVVEGECAKPNFTQALVAATYAWGLLNDERGAPTDWGRVNAAILKRWPRGLERVKILAHRKYEQWTGRKFGR